MLYIVYRGEFCTDKPRNHMARPEVLLVTRYKQKARKKIDDTLNQMKEWSHFTIDYQHENGFDFSNNYDTYGQVGIIEHPEL